MATHYPFTFNYYTTTIPTGDASPNSSAPNPSRIAQPDGLTSPADAVVLWVGDAGSITLSLWYVEAASGEWLPLGGSRTITASGGPVYIPTPAAVPIFAQIASVAGGATKFGIGFTSGEISAATTTAVIGSVGLTGSLPDTAAGDLAASRASTATTATSTSTIASTVSGGDIKVAVQGAGPTTPGSSLSEVQAASTAFSTGQQAITGTAAKLNSGTSTNFGNGFRLKNLSTSTAPLFYGILGVTTSTGDELAPGESVVLPIADISTIYVIAAASSTSTASWAGLV